MSNNAKTSEQEAYIESLEDFLSFITNRHASLLVEIKKLQEKAHTCMVISIAAILFAILT